MWSFWRQVAPLSSRFTQKLALVALPGAAALPLCLQEFSDGITSLILLTTRKNPRPGTARSPFSAAFQAIYSALPSNLNRRLPVWIKVLKRVAALPLWYEIFVNGFKHRRRSDQMEESEGEEYFRSAPRHSTGAAVLLQHLPQ